MRLWDAASRKLMLVLKGHSGPVYRVAFSPSGLQITSCGRDKTIRLWDLHTGESGLVLRGHSAEVVCLAYSPDGNQLASGSMDKTIILWNVTMGCQHLTIERPDGITRNISYSPDGQRIAYCSSSNTSVCSTTTGQLCSALDSKGNNFKSTSILYSPLRRFIVKGDLDKRLRLLDVQSMNCVLMIRGLPANVTNLAWSPNSEHLAVVGLQRVVQLWEIAKGEKGYQARLLWGLGQRNLCLSQVNLELFKQHGAHLEAP